MRTIPIKPPVSATTTKTYYVVAVRLKPDTRFNRSYDWTWLDFREGYRSHCPDVQGAQRFDTPPTLDEIHNYSGWPGYDVHDKRFAPKIFEIVETHDYQVTEVSV